MVHYHWKFPTDGALFSNKGTEPTAESKSGHSWVWKGNDNAWVLKTQLNKKTNAVLPSDSRHFIFPFSSFPTSRYTFFPLLAHSSAPCVHSSHPVLLPDLLGGRQHRWKLSQTMTKRCYPCVPCSCDWMCPSANRVAQFHVSNLFSLKRCGKYIK